MSKRGRPKKIVLEEGEDLNGTEMVLHQIATTLSERCGISGCRAKFHMDEAKVFYQSFVKAGIVRGSD